MYRLFSLLAAGALMVSPSFAAAQPTNTLPAGPVGSSSAMSSTGVRTVLSALFLQVPPFGSTVTVFPSFTGTAAESGLLSLFASTPAAG